MINIRMGQLSWRIRGFGRAIACGEAVPMHRDVVAG
jgi:hypothetical protein